MVTARKNLKGGGGGGGWRVESPVEIGLNCCKKTIHCKKETCGFQSIDKFHCKKIYLYCARLLGESDW